LQDRSDVWTANLTWGSTKEIVEALTTLPKRLGISRMHLSHVVIEREQLATNAAR
jgi:hypothetical protein